MKEQDKIGGTHRPEPQTPPAQYSLDDILEEVQSIRNGGKARGERPSAQQNTTYTQNIYTQLLSEEDDAEEEAYASLQKPSVSRRTKPQSSRSTRQEVLPVNQQPVVRQPAPQKPVSVSAVKAEKPASKKPEPLPAQPEIAEEPLKDKRRGLSSLFKRNKRNENDVDELEAMYGDLKLKPITGRVTEGEQPNFSYLFDESEEKPDEEGFNVNFDEIRRKRQKRVQEAMRNAGQELDDPFELYKKQPQPAPQKESAVPSGGSTDADGYEDISVYAQPPEPEYQEEQTYDEPDYKNDSGDSYTEDAEEFAPNSEEYKIEKSTVFDTDPAVVDTYEDVGSEQFGTEQDAQEPDEYAVSDDTYYSEPAYQELSDNEEYETDEPYEEYEPEQETVPESAELEPQKNAPVQFVEDSYTYERSRKTPLQEKIELAPKFHPENSMSRMVVMVGNFRQTLQGEYDEYLNMLGPRAPVKTKPDPGKVNVRVANAGEKLFDEIQVSLNDIDYDAEQPAVPPEKQAVKHKGKFNILGDEEEDNDPLEERVIPAEDEIDDYNNPADAPSVRHAIGQNIRSLSMRLAITLIGALLMTIMAVGSEYGGVLPAPLRADGSTIVYLAVNFLITLVCVLFCHVPVGSGLSALFKLKANADSGIALASVVALLQNVVVFFFTDRIAAGTLHVYTAIAVLGLFLNTLGKMIMLFRVRDNFKYVSSADAKYAVRIFSDRDASAQMARGVFQYEPVIVYHTKTNFLSSFLTLSYEPDISDRVAKNMAPAGFVASLVLGIATFILSSDLMAALTAFAAAVGICVPAANMMAVNLPLRRLSKFALNNGAMISSYSAVERFSGVNAVILDAQELYPKGSVVMHGIKTFSGQRIDEVILDAAAVMCTIGGPLSELFEQIIQGKRDMLPTIDSLIYEDDMGVIGWVMGRRVLVGNRKLLENHGVQPPSRDFESKYLKGGRQLTYLATGGELVAMFVTSYVADERIAKELLRLEHSGITFFVRTCDPNITAKLIADGFGVAYRAVSILPTSQGRLYKEIMDTSEPRTRAFFSTKGKMTSFFRLLSGIIRIKSNLTLSVVIQSVGVVLGFILVAFLTCYSGVAQLRVFPLFIYTCFWAFASLLFPNIRKP